MAVSPFSSGVSAARRRLVHTLPAPVFVAAGAGARDRTETLRLHPALRLAPTPRHASVLLVAGRIPEACAEALGRVHDQIPSPRGTVLWDARAPSPAAAESASGSRGEGRLRRVEADEDPVGALLDLYRRLLRGEDGGEPRWLPDEPPEPWRGRGEHGQGGEGMMGGVPYGRPMAMTADDLRDGLALDRLELRVGPFFPHFPPGLVLDVALQGDVVQSAEVVSRPFGQPPPEPFLRVLREAVPVAELERSRADALLRSVGRVLRAAGAEALADRALRAALDREAGPRDVRRLRSLLRWGGTLRLAFPEGPAADARGRLLRRLDEAERALRLAVAGAERDSTVGPLERVQDPEGRWIPAGPAEEAAPPADLLPERLPGLEWGQAVTAIAGLGLAPPVDEVGPARRST